MTPDDAEREGWDPTRPLAGSGRERARPEEPLRDDADAGPGGPEGDGPAAGAAGGGARAAGGAPEGGEAAPDAAGGEPVLLPHLERLAALATRASSLEEGAARYAAWAEETLRSGGKLLVCGNGGSAATAEHVAAEYLVRFERDRRPLPAVALTASGPVTTAAANDYSFPEVFERQLAGLAGDGDLVVLHSTSGESENLVRAARAAREAGLRTVALVAAGGGRLAAEVDLALVAPTDEGARAQELHLAVEHAVVDRVEAALAEGAGPEETSR